MICYDIKTKPLLHPEKFFFFSSKTKKIKTKISTGMKSKYFFKQFIKIYFKSYRILCYAE